MKNFGTKDLCKCLENLGFTLEEHQTSSHHYKYNIPKGHVISKGLRPFLMVQMGQKAFLPNSCSRYITEIKRLGFTKEDIDKHFVVK